jgi:hypothetical protein
MIASGNSYYKWQKEPRMKKHAIVAVILAVIAACGAARASDIGKAVTDWTDNHEETILLMHSSGKSGIRLGKGFMEKPSVVQLYVRDQYATVRKLNDKESKEILHFARHSDYVKFADFIERHGDNVGSCEFSDIGGSCIVYVIY